MKKKNLQWLPLDYEIKFTLQKIFKLSVTWVKILWRREWQPTPVLLPGESYGWRSLVGCSPQGHTESDTTEVTVCYVCMYVIWLQATFSKGF